jgi:inorganic pyrophosphatase
MGNLAKLPHRLAPKARTCRVVIETPKGHRAKLDYDAKAHAFFVKTLLPDGMSFPLDFGFVPSTKAGDGDPTDVMVLMDEPCTVGALIDVRLLGVIEAQETEHGRKERNDRILAAACVSRLYEKIAAPEDLGHDFVRNLVEFWVNKAELEGKTFKCLRVSGPEAAVDLVKQTSKPGK